MLAFVDVSVGGKESRRNFGHCFYLFLKLFDVRFLLKLSHGQREGMVD